MICFLGTSHAAEHLREAAFEKCLSLTRDPAYAEVIFISEDTPTDAEGNRDLQPIRKMFLDVAGLGKPIVITSQVPPGFTRSLGYDQRIYHQAETLRIKDAEHRALYPEYIAIGCASYGSYELLPEAYRDYLDRFSCPKLIVQWEEAEFSKIAVNMMLAVQVDATNRLAAAAEKCGATWWFVRDIMQHDKRIGPEAYLTPGRWQDSRHLLRDSVTLEQICTL